MLRGESVAMRQSAYAKGGQVPGAAPTITLALVGRLRYGRSCLQRSASIETVGAPAFPLPLS